MRKEAMKRLAAFYEFHDSILESFVWHGAELKIVLNAVSTLSNGSEPVAYGRQRIELCMDEAVLSGDKVESTIWLLEGEMECENQDSDAIDRVDIGLIPASLKYARNVCIRLFGENEDTGEFPTFEIKSLSLILNKLGVGNWSPEHMRTDVESIERILIGEKIFDRN